MKSHGRFRFTIVAVGCAVAAGVYACNGATAEPGTTTSSTSPETSPPVSLDAGIEAPLGCTFELSGGAIRVAYGTSGGVPFLTYEDELQRRTFTGGEITYSATPAATLVSVVTQRTIDTGATTFTVLVPRVRLGLNSGPVPAATEGITVVHQLSLLLKVGQLDDYTFTPLAGTLSSVDASGGAGED